MSFRSLVLSVQLLINITYILLFLIYVVDRVFVFVIIAVVMLSSSFNGLFGFIICFLILCFFMYVYDYFAIRFSVLNLTEEL